MQRCSRYFVIIFLFFFGVSSFNLYSHGLSCLTPVQLQRGRTCIENIVHNRSQYSKIACFNVKDECYVIGKVRTAGVSTTNCHIRIGFDGPFLFEPKHRDDEILCTPAQEFYVPAIGEWVPACRLEVGMMLQSQSDGTKKITEITPVNKELGVCILEVKKYHNLLVGKYGIVTHNVDLPWEMVLGLSFPFGEGAVAGGCAGGTFGPIGVIGGVVVGGLIGCGLTYYANQNKTHRYETFFDFGAVEDCFNLRNREYEDKRGQRKKEDREFGAQAPGKPTKNDGFIPPKRWNGEKVPHPKNGMRGWPDKDGNIWVPTGPNGHGGAHWDVQDKNGHSYKNVFPGGKVRG